MKTFTKIIAIALFSLPLLANAAGKSASMQVSFEVKESCTVQSNDKSAKTEPAIACQLKTPYQLHRAADAASTASSSDSKAAITTRQDANGDTWTVYF